MTGTTKTYRRTTISLAPGDYEVLRFVAFKRKASVAGLVRQMVLDLIEEEEDIRDGLKALEEKPDTLDWETFKRKHLGVPG
jgi:hypothetical protein